MIVLAMKPSMPNDKTKNSMSVPVLPAFYFQAISPMMNSMNSMKAPIPKVMPNSEICSSVSPNIDGSFLSQLLRLASFAAMRTRSALSLMKPAASLWS